MRWDSVDGTWVFENLEADGPSEKADEYAEMFCGKKPLFAAQDDLSLEECRRVLEVGRFATKGDIRQAYHAKIRIYHPDKFGSHGAGQFIKIQSAYKCLARDDSAKSTEFVRAPPWLYEFAYFRELFGGAKFKRLLEQPLCITTMEFGLKTKRRLQKIREHNVAKWLSLHVAPFVNGDEGDFDRVTRALVADLRTASSASLLLRVYGFVLGNATDRWLGDVGRFAKRPFAEGAADFVRGVGAAIAYELFYQRVGWGIMSTTDYIKVDQASFHFYCNMVAHDIELTVSHAVGIALHDVAVTEEARRSRAEAFKRMGAQFVAAASEITDAPAEETCAAAKRAADEYCGYSDEEN